MVSQRLRVTGQAILMYGAVHFRQLVSPTGEDEVRVLARDLNVRPTNGLSHRPVRAVRQLIASCLTDGAGPALRLGDVIRNRSRHGKVHFDNAGVRSGDHSVSSSLGGRARCDGCAGNASDVYVT